MSCSVVIVAAGSGNRMGKSINKLFIEFLNKPLLAYSIDAFNIPKVDEIIIVLKDEYMKFVKERILETYRYDKKIKLVSGGVCRQHSVYNGLLSLSAKSGIVLVHDGARPFIDKKDIVNVLNDAFVYKAAVLGVKLKDTVKSCDDNRFIVNTVDRSTLWAMQTPQAYDYGLLMSAYEKAWQDNYIATDDAALVERFGGSIKITEGSSLNFKITTPDDVVLAKAIFSIYNDPENLPKSVENNTEINAAAKCVEIYTDGACSHNPGKGGYGVVLLFNGKRKELSGGFNRTTNNRMEIFAVIKGLEELKGKCDVKLYSDSKYVVDAIEKGWVNKWKKNNWMRNSHEKALNVDLWQRLLPLLQKHNVEFIWVKGHNSNKENERCDALATSFIIKGHLEDDINYNN